MVDNTEYLARIRRPMHELAKHEVFSCYTYRYDLLHSCDNHGVTSHMIGNVLWSHVSADREGGIIAGHTVEDRRQL